MTYSEKDLEEISADPVRERAYFWRVAMLAKQRARRIREFRAKGGVSEDSLVENAEFNDRFADLVLGWLREQPPRA